MHQHPVTFWGGTEKGKTRGLLVLCLSVLVTSQQLELNRNLLWMRISELVCVRLSTQTDEMCRQLSIRNQQRASLCLSGSWSEIMQRFFGDDEDQLLLFFSDYYFFFNCMKRFYSRLLILFFLLKHCHKEDSGMPPQVWESVGKSMGTVTKLGIDKSIGTVTRNPKGKTLMTKALRQPIHSTYKKHAKVNRNFRSQDISLVTFTFMPLARCRPPEWLTF